MIYDHIRDLPVIIDEVALDRLDLEVSPQFTRVTTLVLLRGGGHEGIGEDVTYEADEVVAFAIAGAPDLRGEWTIHSLSQALDGIDLFPTPPSWEPSRAYFVLSLRVVGRNLFQGKTSRIFVENLCGLF